MNVVTTIRIFLIAMLLFAANSYADTLSDRTITSFISSLDELNAMEDEFDTLDMDLEADNDDELAMPDFAHVISGGLKDMKGHSDYDKLAKVVKRHGFRNPEQWAQTGDRIFHAWMALEMDTQSAEVSQEMKKALVELDNNPDMTPAQKEQMKAMMGGVMSTMKQAINAPKADMNSVRPHMNALRAVTESEAD
ncbi:MAG: hypothetical protein WCX90_10730 [Thiohalomonadaceae bacterium]